MPFRDLIPTPFLTWSLQLLHLSRWGTTFCLPAISESTGVKLKVLTPLMNQPEVAWFNKTTHFDPPFVPIYPRRKIIITWTHMTDFTPLEERGGAGWHPNHFEAVLHINVSYHNNLVSYLPICHSHKFHEQESSIDDLPLTRKDRQPPAGPKARAPAMQQVSSICQSTSLILPSPPAARRAKLKNVSPELFSNTELATT